MKDCGPAALCRRCLQRCLPQALDAQIQGSTAPPPLRPSAYIDRSSESEFEEEKEWYQGGRYRVIRDLPVFSGSELCERLGACPAGCDVVLVALAEAAGGLTGFVYSGHACGWVALDGGALLRQRQFGSWDVGGRYLVQFPATLREGASLKSAVVGELIRDQEVLVMCIELSNGLRAAVPGVVSRLRAQVLADGVIGWLTLETPTGVCLLHPLNLHSSEAAQLLKDIILEKKTSSGRTLPWQRGGKYLILEDLYMYESPTGRPNPVTALRAGTMIQVREIHYVEYENVGWCAWVLAEAEVPDQSVLGWVCCSAADDNRDVIDSRNQLELETIAKVLSGNSTTAGCSPESETAACEAPALAPLAAEAEGAAGDCARINTCGYSSVPPLVDDSEAVAGAGEPTPPEFPALVRKLAAMEEEGPDTKKVTEDVLDSSMRCEGCTCGAGRDAQTANA